MYNILCKKAVLILVRWKIEAEATICLHSLSSYFQITFVFTLWQMWHESNTLDKNTQTNVKWLTDLSKYFEKGERKYTKKDFMGQQDALMPN